MSSTTEPTEQSIKVRRWKWRTALVVTLVAIKLALVSHHEIAVHGNDDANFAYAAVGGYFNVPYGPYTHVRQPVYPLLLHGWARLGVPARLGVEATWIGACAVLVCGFRATGAGTRIALAAGGLSLFHPWTFNWFDRLAQDNLYAPAALGFFAGLGAALSVPRPRGACAWGALAAAGGAVAANTRPESELLYGSLAAAAVIALAGLWRRSGLENRRRVPVRVLAAVLLPLLVMQAATWGLQQRNKRAIGLPVTADLSLPGFTRLYTELLSITPPLGAGGGPAADPALPITRPVRERAYSASPTFASLRPWLDGEHPAEAFQRACERQTGATGEYGAWTVWAIRWAAWQSRGDSPWTSAAEIDRFYSRAAAELRDAGTRGDLPRRAVPIPFIPPEWPEIARRLPRSALAACAMILTTPFSFEHSERKAMRMRPAFDLAAGRRSSPSLLVDTKAVGVDGSVWYSAPMVRAFRSVERGIAGAYRLLVPAAAALAVAGVVAALARRRRMRLPAGWWAMSLLLWSALAARLLLVSLMDVTGLPVLTRYLLVCPPILFALGGLGYRSLAEAWAGQRRTPQPEGRPDASAARNATA